jgi:hypothetical protein
MGTTPWRSMGDPRILDLGASGQPHTPVALTSAKETPVPRTDLDEEGEEENLAPTETRTPTPQSSSL